MRTLIYHDGALGDVLLSLPCMQAIGEDGGELHIVCRPDIGGLLAELMVVGGHTSSDSGLFASLFAAAGPCERANAFLGRFDRSFLFTAKQDPVLLRNLRGPIPVTRAIATLPPGGSRVHAADFRLTQVAGSTGAAASPGLTAPPAVRNAALPLLLRAGLDGPRSLIVIHPGSGGKRKCWPLEGYFRVAERLAADPGRNVLFLSGPAEGPDTAERIRRFVHGRERTALVVDADLVAVAGLLSRCGLCIGNDSGISHLAAVMRSPTITLFGPTDPELWRPRGPAVQVIAGDTIGSITVDQVMDAADEMLSRHAGHHRGAARKGSG